MGFARIRGDRPVYKARTGVYKGGEMDEVS